MVTKIIACMSAAFGLCHTRKNTSFGFFEADIRGRCSSPPYATPSYGDPAPSGGVL
jgi:hypothetical protein